MSDLTLAGRRMTPALLLQPSQGGKRGWFEFDALACAWVKTASLLKCPFEAKKDPLVTERFSGRPVFEKRLDRRLGVVGRALSSNGLSLRSH